VRQKLGPNITDYIIAVAKLFDDPRVYQPAKVRPEILDLAEALSGAKQEITNLIMKDMVKRWYKVTFFDEKTKLPISNLDYFMDQADEWGKPSDGMGKPSDGMGMSSDGMGMSSDGMGKPSDGMGMSSDGMGMSSDLTHSQEGSTETTSTPELNPFSEGNEGGGE
jgi:hypothetical protein